MAHDGIVYLLHFERSARHAGHYIGFTQNLDERLVDDRAGRGSPLIAAAIADGIDFQLAAIWQGDRHDEQCSHRQKSTRARLCPICAARHRAAPVQPATDLVDELLLSVLGGIPQPGMLTALQSQLRRRGKRIGSVHGGSRCSRYADECRRRGCSGEIAWAIVPASARRGAGRRPEPPTGRSVPSQDSHPGGCVGVGERPRHPGGPNPKGKAR